jgi:hypothetical protein
MEACRDLRRIKAYVSIGTIRRYRREKHEQIEQRE